MAVTESLSSLRSATDFPSSASFSRVEVYNNSLNGIAVYGSSTRLRGLRGGPNSVVNGNGYGAHLLAAQ